MNLSEAGENELAAPTVTGLGLRPRGSQAPKFLEVFAGAATLSRAAREADLDAVPPTDVQ